MEAALITAVGLSMDIIAIWVLALFGDMRFLCWYGRGDPSNWVTQRARAAPFMNKLGLVSLTVGFLLQMCGALWVP